MARIRSIHPGIYTDEAFMELTEEAPLAVVLLFGLWSEADDQGVFVAKALTLKARILPAASADVKAMLTTLERLNFICRFTVEGREYGAIRNFCRFQRPKKPKHSHPLPEALRGYVAAGELGSGASDEESEAFQGGDGKGKTVGSPPVGNRFPTGGEIPSQREEGGGRREESLVPSLRSGTPPAAPAEPEAVDRDVRVDLETEGLALVEGLTGKRGRPARALLGSFAKAARDNCALVLTVLREAKANQPCEPVAWIFGAIDTRLERRAASGEEVLPPVERDQDGLRPDQRRRVDELLKLVQAGVAEEHQDRRRIEGFLRNHDAQAWRVAQRELGARIAA